MCEAIINGKIIPVGDTHSFLDLPTGKVNLTEHYNIQPLFPHMKISHRSQDGCVDQYQGRKYFRGWQTMSARLQMECEDTQNPEN